MILVLSFVTAASVVAETFHAFADLLPVTPPGLSPARPRFLSHARPLSLQARESSVTSVMSMRACGPLAERDSSSLKIICFSLGCRKLHDSVRQIPAFDRAAICTER